VLLIPIITNFKKNLTFITDDKIFGNVTTKVMVAKMLVQDSLPIKLIISKCLSLLKFFFSKSSPPTVYTMTSYIRLPYFSPFLALSDSPNCICVHQVGSISSFLPTYELIKAVLTVYIYCLTKV
jgi:hypothetical protein